MNDEVKTKKTKGISLRKIAALALVAALLLAVGSVFVSAASNLTGQFQVAVLDNTNVDENGKLTGKPTYKYRNEIDDTAGYSSVEGKATFAKDATVNGAVDKLFTLETVNNVKRIELIFSEYDADMKISVSTGGNGKWRIGSSQGNQKRYVYYSTGGIDKDTFNNTLMNLVNISSYGKTNAASSCTITLVAYNTTSMYAGESNQLGYHKNLGGTTYTLKLTLFNYATAEADTDSVVVDAKSKEGEENKLTPDTDGTVSATFKMNVTNTGSGEYLRLGYQIKEAGTQWIGDALALHGIEDNQYIYYRGKKNDSTGKYDVDSGKKQFSELGTWDDSTNAISKPKPVKITVDGLDPDKEYTIRGVVVTNEDTTAYTTEKSNKEFTVSYSSPIINSLDMNGTAAQLSGATKKIGAKLQYPNRNYDNTEQGPKLQAKLYFTTDKTDNGTEDTSTWKKVGDSITLVPTKDKTTGEYSVDVPFEDVAHTLPEQDAKNASYKLVLTDLNTSGYQVTAYASGTFIVDAKSPTKPEIKPTTEGLDLNLIDGSAVVGGSSSGVDLTVYGSTDAASGLKGYSYTMFYVESGKINSFIRDYNTNFSGKLTTTSSNEEILTAMKSLTADKHGSVAEYTAESSLETTNAQASLSIAKDGFYCVKLTAVDEVGRKSEETTAIFRVDTTPPSTPTLALVKRTGKTGYNGNVTLDSKNFDKYDNRTYSASEVWVLVHTDVQAGKTMKPELYEYSIDGGLTWKKITDAPAYTLTGGSMQVYNDVAAGTMKTFTYDAAFQLSSQSVNGYKTVMMRGTDSQGNVSGISAGAEMRVNETPVATGTMSHENIEIALSMGNTGLENTGKIQGDMRNLVAQKINEKFYGSDSTIVKALAEHECTWDNGGDTCDTGDACPYNDYPDAYSPSMVGMQGLSSANAATDSSFNWVRFDHTNYVKQTYTDYVTQQEVTKYIPTVVFDVSSPLHSTADNNIDDTQSTYYAKVDGEVVKRYTAMTDYVVYTGQKTVAAKIEDLDSQTDTIHTTDALTLTGFMSHRWNNGSPMGDDTYTAAGRYGRGSTNYQYQGDMSQVSSVRGRVYHMVDMTHTVTHEVKKEDDTYQYTDVDYTYETSDISAADTYEDRMSRIFAMGYVYSASKDWLFLYNGQSTLKKIFFTIDDRMVFPHSTDGYGFWFNTTIRQNVAGEWTISGYLLGIADPVVEGSQFQKYIIKIEDMRLDWFANSRVTTSGETVLNGKGTAWSNEDFFHGIIKSMLDNSKSQAAYAGGTISILARNAYDGAGKLSRNYVLVTEGSKTQLYVYNKNDKTKDELQTLFDEQYKNKNWETDVTKGYTKVSWKQLDLSTPYVYTNPNATEEDKKDPTLLYTPPVSMDGYAIGDLSIYDDDTDLSELPHTDSNCYGFGPVAFGGSTNHGCERDSVVVFSNILMNVDKARSLSEVITEPKWGESKVKYILNVSDDSISDLQDPILSANIIWRVQNEGVKFINWGSLTNKKSTEEFIENKIEGNGTYVVARATTYDDKLVYPNGDTTQQKVKANGQQTQTNLVAEYIANEYYKSYGINPDSEESVPDQLGQIIAKKNTVYSMENAQRLTFSVTDQTLMKDTANEDFPSGRWYITYDATGYTGHTSYANFSDSLDVKVTEPGRYAVYFAPDVGLLGDLSDPTDDGLDSSNPTCVYSFIVSEEATAEPIAMLTSGGNIKIEDYSIDPDNNVYANLNDNNKYYQKLEYKEGIQLTGITGTSWRWELSVPYTNPVTLEKSSVVIMTGGDAQKFTRDSSTMQISDPFTDKTIKELTLNAQWVSDYKTYMDSDLNRGNQVSYEDSKPYYSEVPTGATLTIYEKVFSTNTRRTAAGKYEVVESETSPEKSTNLVRQGEGDNAKPIRPSSALTLSDTILYDTADDTTGGITVTRSSFHGQKETLKLGWEVTPHGTSKATELTTEDNGKNWYMTYEGKELLVLKSITAPTQDMTSGRTSGEWLIPKNAIETLSGSLGGSFALRIVETVQSTISDGDPKEWSDGTVGEVNDSSGRTIFYRQDTGAPTIQSVTLQEGTYSGSKWTYTDYSASGYLDMTKAQNTEGAKQILLTVSGSTDREGKVKGYGYYFYATENGKTVYYKHDTKTGKLTTVTNAKDALVKLEDANGLASTDKKTFTIDCNAMFLDGTERKPLVSLNVAVFAYDNSTTSQTAASGNPVNFTSGNETAPTKIENIKLAKFTPTALAMTAVTNTGDTIVTIDHDGNTKTPKGMVNTNVTVSFAAKQAWYNYDATTGKATLVQNQNIIDKLDKGETVTGGNYVKYFVDATGEADLTAKVTVDYEVYFKATKNGNHQKQDYLSKTGAKYTDTFTVSSSGYYQVTATPKNGSGVAGKAQTINFVIDREAPTGLQVTVYDDKGNEYTSGTWVKKAQVNVEGAKDDNDAHYEYSSDNGASWKQTTNTNTFQFDLTETGTYVVRVKAVDAAGNEQEASSITVQVDNNPPKTAAPTVKASSTSYTVYDECVIAVEQSENGTVKHLSGYDPDTGIGTPVDDDDVVVKPGETAYFLITPEDGYDISYVKLSGTMYAKDSDLLTEYKDGGYVFKVEDVQEDYTLRAAFVAEGSTQSFMASARVASYNAVRALRTASDETAATYADETEIETYETTYSVSIPNEDWDKTFTTASPENGIKGGESSTLTITTLTGYDVDYITVKRGSASPVKVSVGELKKTTTGYTYEIEDINTNIGVTVVAKAKTLTTFTVEVEGHGTASVTGAEKTGYETYSGYVGDTITLTTNPEDSEYVLKSVLVDGEEKADSANPVDTYEIAITENMTVKVEFKVAETDERGQAKLTVKIAPNGSSDNGDYLYHGTISPSGEVITDEDSNEQVHTITLKAGGNQTVLFKPESGYYPTNVLFTASGEYAKTETLTPQPYGDTGYYSVTISGLKGYDNKMTFNFARKKHQISVTSVIQIPGEEDSYGGGTIKINGLTTSQATVEEGEDVTITITPDSEYRIKSVTKDGVELGNLRSLTLKEVSDAHNIQVTFVKRNFRTIKTTHTLTATAMGITDMEDALDAQPYQFVLIDDSTGKKEYSAWQSSTSITYTDLKPNHNYTVMVIAKDKQGNKSVDEAIVTSVDGKDVNAATKCTYANVPAATAVEENDEENSLDKTVKVTVDSMGNPEDTEYSVYYSDRANMRGMEQAVVVNGGDATDENSKWTTLNADGTITVYQLSAGTRYYLQVVARNKDKEATTASSDSILEITLSPTSPPENSMYFEEQAGPHEGITLHWDDPAGDISQFYIYRDGTKIAELDSTQRKYTDEYTNLSGDGAYVYSYAYVNASGVGARRTAVSEEYYNAVKAVEKAEDDTAKQEAQDALDKLDSLKTLNGSNYENLYKEVMTYPEFPANFYKTQATTLNSSEYSGVINVRILPESGATARAQKYVVGLRAYSKDEETGKYTQITDGTKYGTNNETVWNESEWMQTTTCTSALGATATWSNLNSKWEYRVYVMSVSSTGALQKKNNSIVDGYQSGSSIEMEEALGRTYTVSWNGYGYTYSNSSATANGLKESEKVVWTSDAESNVYTTKVSDTYTGWYSSEGKGILLKNRSGDDYIKFNQNPTVFIPKTEDSYDTDFLYQNLGNTVSTVYGKDFLLAETDGETTKVKLKVKVYDTDGPADDNYNYTVTAKLGGITATSVLKPVDTSKPAVGDKPSTATDCELEFNFENVATGLYDELKLYVANGAVQVQSAEIPAGTVNVVVNQSQPTISASNGGAVKKIQDGRDYGTTSSLTVTSGLSGDMDAMRKARVVLMADQYTDLSSIAEKVLNGTATEEEKAQIDAVNPKIVSYFQVSKDVYNQAKNMDATKVTTTQPTADKVYYWVERELAFEKGWCTFLTRDEDGSITANRPEGDTTSTQYPLLVTSYFGSNKTTMTLRFQVMDAPELKVATQQTWKWLVTTSKEYDTYKESNWTIGAIYTKANDRGALSDTIQRPSESGFTESDVAYRKNENGTSTVYEVFKLYDEKINIQDKVVSGSISVKTGMYSQIEQIQLVMVPGKEAIDPSKGVTTAEPPKDNTSVEGSDANMRVMNVKYQGNAWVPNNVTAAFSVNSLQKDTTYHLWVYYKVKDPELGKETWYHEENCVALTTEDTYQVASIGFGEVSRTYKEAEHNTGGTQENITLVRTGDYGATGVKVRVEAKYYRADEYGNMQYTDEEKTIEDEIKLGDPEYAAALATVQLSKNEYTLDKGTAQMGFSYYVYNTPDKQGHMIVRFTMTIEETIGDDGINRETPDATVFEIFVQDDETEITTYKIGFDENEAVTKAESGDDHWTATTHYDYTFKGLPATYDTSKMSSLALSLKNIGQGDLTDIQATLLDKDRKNESTDFVFSTTLTTNALSASEEDQARSNLKVIPANNLSDGIHEGWLKITANRVQDEDVIWVHLYQVVGQATLQGNVYIGEKPLTSGEFAGIATVKIYSSSDATGANRGDPLYQTDTDENGYYEIPNIIVGKQYAIVIERVGCATFDALAKKKFWTPEKSAAYQFDLEMVAGEIVSDGSTVAIDAADRKELEKYMNTTVASAKDTDYYEVVRRCDLNQDGIVNVLDRMLLWKYLNRGSTVNGMVVALYNWSTLAMPTEVLSTTDGGSTLGY